MSRNLHGMCTSARVWYSKNERSSENNVVVLFRRAKHVPQWQTLTSSLALGRPVNPLGVDSRRAGVKLLWRFPCRKNVFTGARLGSEESVNSRVSSGSHLPLPSLVNLVTRCAFPLCSHERTDRHANNVNQTEIGPEQNTVLVISRKLKKI